MLSAHRKHSFLLTLCALIALVLMSGSVVPGAHAHAGNLLQGLQHAATSVVSDGHASIAQPSDTDDSSGSRFMLVDDNDLDDELVLPSPVRVWLHHVPSAAPLSARASRYPAPVSSLLRPPSLA